MLHAIAEKYKKIITYCLFLIFYMQTIIAPLYAATHIPVVIHYPTYSSINIKNKTGKSKVVGKKEDETEEIKKVFTPVAEPIEIKLQNAGKPGPVAPEASSFKPVGSDNLVNLFTGDFSYSIPLLDVGGYPVNLFYSAGIGMEQEASWVGLGWNINPGTVNRNMRGVPDDFNGEDKLKQTQHIKPNRTWGGEVGYDGEVLGYKQPKVNLSLGYSYNNYLGPALEIGAGVSLTIPIIESVKTEKASNGADSILGKNGLSANASVNAKLSSRSGLTFSPSLGASLQLKSQKDQIGVGLSTSYNSRTGIKELNLSMSTSLTYKEDKNSKINMGGSSSISFARPSYMPVLRMPMEYANYSGQIEVGLGMFGVRGAAHAQGYYSESKVPSEWRVLYKPLVGFMYAEKANGNKDAVMDFNRLNDAEVTPNTPIISAPQYAYDVFSIQGEGTGGSIRAFRGDLGFVRDNETRSKDKNISIGADVAPGGHFGINWNIIKTPTRVGGWEDGNNGMRNTVSFKPKTVNNSFENVYFRNPGEATVSNPELINRIGGDNLVRFKLSGSDANTRLESLLEVFDKKTLTQKQDLPISTQLTGRDKRTQVTTMLTAGEASEIGLERKIRNYTGLFNSSDTTIQYSEISRDSEFRKKHHISEITVLEQTGMRYVYGLPVYNLVQKDYTFSVNNTGNSSTGIVNFDTNEPELTSPHMNNSSTLDGYLMIQETPAYAASFLLTGLLSPDYVDVTGNGITEDDLGGAVKFNYKKSANNHKWRTPRGNANGNTAHFNEGLKSEKKDNKANISYGEREVWYLGSIESKSMIALFSTEAREDAKGVMEEFNGTRNAGEDANKKLSRIDLYTKAEIKAKGLANAKPIKTVHFDYAYTLCKGTPDNTAGKGKLTLRSVYFSYNGQIRLNKDKYVFNYGDSTLAKDNPDYAYQSSDKWGTYKNAIANPNTLSNADHPYTSKDKTKNDEYAGAWSLKKILLPSGGQMEVTYEGDDYGYVQNRRACDMFNIYGLGNNTVATTDSGLYNNGLPNTTLANTDNFYVYIQIPEGLQQTNTSKQKQEILDKYLEGAEQLAFKLLIKMPKGYEALTVYAKYDDWGLCSNSPNKDLIYIKLRPVDGKSPLSKSAIGFITENLPGQAFEGYDVEPSGVKAFLEMMGAMLSNVKNAFRNVDEQMRSAPKARTIQLDKSFVRLNNPNKMKYGGGLRVKRVIVKDNWNKMTGQYTSEYGQDYDYTTTEKINGVEKIISSGVASYEPGLGSEENPFREIISFSNKMPLASAQYGAIEMPMLDGLYPAPGVGYSKVSVRSIHRKGKHQDSLLRSAIGKQVTEFYTAKDYPVTSTYTTLKSKEHHFNSFFNILYKTLTDRKTVTQGFLVETNDMHGKMKMQAAYSESDEKTPLSYSYHTYKNTGKNGLNDTVNFVYNETGGTISAGNMGIDMELMTDVREFTVLSNGFNGQIQTDFFTFVPWPIFAIPMLPIKTYTENKYRAVTCTKLINYHAIEDSVIVMDKGSVISTKTIAYDAETGAPIVTQTRNEFKDPIYNVSYPAYWAYSGMGPAYKNIGAKYTNVNFYDGKIIAGPDASVFESGDELYIVGGSGTTGCIPESQQTIKKIWVLDKNKNHTALTANVKDLVFMDSLGYMYTKKEASFIIVRSGKRNSLGSTISTATAMASPLQIVGGINKLIINNACKVVSSSAVEYKEKWQTDHDVFLRRTYYADACTGIESDTLSCNGTLERNVNPYLKGLIGNFKPYRSYVYYGDRNETDATVATNIRTNGYLNNFANFWDFNVSNNVVPDYTNVKWTWNSELSKVNAKGQELETKDALNRYSAAQFGFEKNMAVAVIQNARYGESFYEGFEDDSYSERLNPMAVQGNCAVKYISFKGLGNSTIKNTSLDNIRSHSGHKSLVINGGDTVTKQIPIRSEKDDFHFDFTRENVNSFIPGSYGSSGMLTLEYGPQYSTFIYPLYNYNFPNNGSVGLRVYKPTAAGGTSGPLLTASGSLMTFKRIDTTVQYFKVTQQHNFSITVEAKQGIVELGDQDLHIPNLNRAAITVTITNINGTNVTNQTLYSDNFNSPSSSTLHSVTTNGINLPCGIYKVWTSVTSDIRMNTPFNATFHKFYTESSYSTTINGIRGSYISCSFDKPIPAKDSMHNPVQFALVPDKKMHFSAWVKQLCATDTCTDFSKSNITIWSNGSNVSGSVIRRGAIIEGWQKIEGDFTIPLNASSAQIRFINSNNANMYVDDIRIHPFNANMKSYVYDPRTLRLSGELDENNYTTFYEYDEEGQLVRVKKETAQGIKTIKESRAAKQQGITEVQ